ncbi:hypothetical protein Tco_1421094 [Tanacetum coccineum]
MSKNNASTASNVESKCTLVDDIESNQAMSDKLQTAKVDVIGKIIVMIGRKWDVSSVTGRYLSMDFVVSDAKDLSDGVRPATSLPPGNIKYYCFLTHVSGGSNKLEAKLPANLPYESWSTFENAAASHTPEDTVTRHIPQFEKNGTQTETFTSILYLLNLGTPLKPSEEGIKIRVDADSEARGDTREADRKGKAARDSEKGRNKRFHLMGRLAKTRLASIRLIKTSWARLRIRECLEEQSQGSRATPHQNNPVQQHISAAQGLAKTTNVGIHSTISDSKNK